MRIIKIGDVRFDIDEIAAYYSATYEDSSGRRVPRTEIVLKQRRGEVIAHIPVEEVDKILEPYNMKEDSPDGRRIKP